MKPAMREVAGHPLKRYTFLACLAVCTQLHSIPHYYARSHIWRRLAESFKETSESGFADSA